MRQGWISALTVLAAIAGVAAQVQADGASSKQASRGASPSEGEILSTWTEVPAERTARRRVFVSPDGAQVRAIVSYTPRWDPATGREISADLVLAGDVVASDQGDLRIEAPVATGAPARMILADGSTIEVGTQVRFVHEGASVVPARASVPGARPAPAQVRYAGAVEGGDLVLESRPGVLETSLALTAAPALASTAGAVAFEEVLSLPAGWTVQGLEGAPGIVVAPEAGSPAAGFTRIDQHLYLLDALGEMRATIEAPRVFEAGAPEQAARAFADVRFDAASGRLVYRTSAPAAWLADPARVFPVIFDPALTANTPVSISTDSTWSITSAAGKWNTVAVSGASTADWDIETASGTYFSDLVPPDTDFLIGDGHRGAHPETSGNAIQYTGTSAATLEHAAPGAFTVGTPTTFPWAANEVISTFEVTIAAGQTGAKQLQLTGLTGLFWDVVPPAPDALLVSRDDALIVERAVAATPASIPFATAGVHTVVVWRDGGPGAAGTISVTWPGTTPPSTAPTLTSIAPASVAPNTSFTLTATGTNFTTSSVVKIGTTSLTTTFVSATQLSAAVPAASIPTAGTYQITVADGANTTAARTLTAANRLLPPTTTPGGSDFTAVELGGRSDSGCAAGGAGGAAAMVPWLVLLAALVATRRARFAR